MLYMIALFKAQLLAIYFKLKQNDYKFANA